MTLVKLHKENASIKDYDKLDRQIQKAVKEDDKDTFRKTMKQINKEFDSNYIPSIFISEVTKFVTDNKVNNDRGIVFDSFAGNGLMIKRMMTRRPHDEMIASDAIIRKKRFNDIYEADAVNMIHFNAEEEDTLILMYPPKVYDIPYETIEEFKGNKVVYLGFPEEKYPKKWTSPAGITTKLKSPFDILNRDYTLVKKGQAIPTSIDNKDKISFVYPYYYVRNDTN